jgi:hypothetical protein
MADYSKGIIYTIRSKDNIYVGSTLNFASRKWKHKYSIYNENSKEYNYKLYKTIRENNYEWIMQPYKEYPCETKIQLRIEEERVRQLLNADMNSQSCGSGYLTKKEYSKQYCEEHKDEKKEYDKQYREEHKDERKEQKKQYIEQNKDKISEQKKQYYDENKNKISEKRKQKITCECGCVVTKRHISKHHESKKHIDLIAKLNH